MKHIITPELHTLRALFVREGHECWLVGGACRDLQMGIKPKDIDLATSATPDEQIALYRAHGLQYIPTGLAHGTVSVVLDQTYEITSLRTESNHDGRHASVAYTRDLRTDCERRDLTINAIAMDFDGNIIDYFGGIDDIKNRRVRFVGEAEERMREDYLRILRFFRFHTRIAGDAPFDAEAVAAILETRAGLAQISVERIWMEMRKIISGPSAMKTLQQMIELIIFEIIQMPYGDFSQLQKAYDAGIIDPASLMGFYLNEKQVVDLSQAWKWSNAETDRALYISRHKSTERIASFKEMLVDGVEIEWVYDLMTFNQVDPLPMMVWKPPVFPVTGADLIATGMKPSREMGEVLRKMTEEWKKSDYTMTKEELLNNIAVT